jgi:hypothetical protein
MPPLIQMRARPVRCRDTDRSGEEVSCVPSVSCGPVHPASSNNKRNDQSTESKRSYVLQNKFMAWTAMNSMEGTHFSLVYLI